MMFLPCVFAHESLYGIWEGKDRFVFFEEGHKEGSTQIVMLLKEYYGWYYDRAVEPKEMAEIEPRTRNSGTTKDASQVYFDVKNIKNDDELFSAFELELNYSRKQKTIVPVFITDGKMYLNYYLQDGADKNLFIGNASSRGITMYEQPLPENLSVLYLIKDAFYDVRYWKTDMDFAEEKVTFARDDIEFFVPKHVRSREQNYSSVSGRSKKVRNPQKSFTAKEFGLTLAADSATDSRFIIKDKEPYLIRLADKKDFEALIKIVKESNARRKPDPPALFPPHEPPLDWHWDLIDALEKYNPYVQEVRKRQKDFGIRGKDINR